MVCVAICWQDVLYRAVYWVWYPVLFVVSVLVKWETMSVENWMYNSFFILLLMGTLTLYLTIRKGQLINITNGFFSWGDILMLVAVIPLFSPSAYMLYFTFGTLFVLLLHILAHIYRPQTTVPYAGYMSLSTIGFLLIEDKFSHLLFI